MQARIQKRGVQQVLRLGQTVGKLHLGQHLMLAEVHFLNATKARSIFQPEPSESLIKLGNRQCLLTAAANLRR